jgi:hypothetical protein
VQVSLPQHVSHDDMASFFGLFKVGNWPWHCLPKVRSWPWHFTSKVSVVKAKKGIVKKKKSIFCRQEHFLDEYFTSLYLTSKAKVTLEGWCYSSRTNQTINVTFKHFKKSA